VGDVAVFGVPDDEWGESVVAAVEPSPGVGWNREVEKSVLDHARARLAPYKVPRAFAVHKRLPRLDTGKLAVRQLRAPYWEGRERAI
jgi:long-chain acyl-CoA synthetase